jgi:hypothetical protein
VTCAGCKRKTSKDGNKFFPFCSERCQMADLGHWLCEEYRIPEDDDAPPPPPDARGPN